MASTDEELLHAFYAGDTPALHRLAEHHEPLLWEIAFVILQARTGSAEQALNEWDIEDRLVAVWLHVHMTRLVSMGSWPHQRLSALTWLIHITCLEMDQHLGFRGPF